MATSTARNKKGHTKTDPTKEVTADITANTKQLFVVIDPTIKRQLAFEKALLVASMGDFSIHLFVCTYGEISEHRDFSSQLDLKLYMLDKVTQQLAALTKQCSDNKLSVTSEVVWHKNWYEMAVQAIARSGCDLVVKSSFHHSKIERYFYQTSDFFLMRYCPTPVLFAHQSQQWQSSHLMACIDLESSDSGHRLLNNRIIKSAKILSKVMGMQLYIIATYEKGYDSSILKLVMDSSVGTREKLAEIYEVTKEQILLRRGDTVETIQSISEEMDASIMVIGCLARTGIAGKVIGNTAEKLIDIVNADIVTIS